MKSFLRCSHRSTATTASSIFAAFAGVSSSSPSHVLPFLAPAVYRQTHVLQRRNAATIVNPPPPIAPAESARSVAEKRKDAAAIGSLRTRLEREPMPKESENEDKEEQAGSGSFWGPQKMDHFSEDEIAVAHEHLRHLRNKRQGQSAALEALVATGRRRPQYVYTVLPDALAAVEEEVRLLSDEIALLRHDLTERRQHRFSVRYMLYKGNSVEKIRLQFGSLGLGKADRHFGLCITYLLHYRRLYRLSARFLEAYATMLRSSRKSVGTAFHILVAERLGRTVEKVNMKRRRKKEVLAEELLQLLLRMTKKVYVHVPQPALYLTALNLPQEKLGNYYWDLINHGIRFHPYTTFHVVAKLTRPDEETGVSHWQTGIAVLRAMRERKESLYSIQGQYAFYTILYQALLANDQAATEDILSLMAECNLSPGVEVYNMLMSRAALSGDDDAIKSYYDAIYKSGLQPTVASHAIIHAYYKRRDEQIRESTELAARRIDQRLNKYIATDILHSMVLKRKPWMEVLYEYRTLFNTSILESFRLVPTPSSPEILHQNRQKLRTDHATLAVMFTSYCQSERNIAKIWDLYQIYRSKLFNKDSNNLRIRQYLLQAGAYIPHTIMLGLGKRANGLRYVAAVLEDMLAPDAPVESDVYTWSIFVNFLTRARKMQEAETVLSIMKRRGILPNIVTFSTLLNGYVRMRQMEVAEEVLRRMEEEQQTPTVITWTNLLHGYVKERDDWKAGNTFKRMLDSSVQPDDVTLHTLSEIVDRGLFEKGLSGEERQGVEKEENRGD